MNIQYGAYAMKTDDCFYTDIRKTFRSGQETSRPLSEGVSGIFVPASSPGELKFNLSEDLGFGIIKRWQLGSLTDIFFGDIRPYRDLELSGMTQGDAYVFLFCLGEPMVWQEAKSKKTMTLKKDTGLVCHVRDMEETGIYERNRHYRGVTLTFHPDAFLNYFTPEMERTVFTGKSNYFEAVAYPLSCEAKVVLAEILRCPYSGMVQTLYLEGKALELLAVSMNSVTESLKHDKDRSMKLSEMDILSIEQSKKILDSSVSCPVTITSLARLVCMNESKLKSGFKYLYGKPIYSYFLDKRLESARLMLETQPVSVGQVAGFVGYQSGSSFSKAFYKRFGFYPSEYRRL